VITNQASDYNSVVGFAGAGNGWNDYTAAEEITMEMDIGGSGTFTVGESVTQQDSNDTFILSCAAKAIVVAWDSTNRLLTLGTFTQKNAFGRTRGTIGNVIGATSSASWSVANNITYESVYNADTTPFFSLPAEVDETKTWQVSLTTGSNFTSEEVLTGAPSGATGTVSNWDSGASPDRLTIENISGTFTTSDTVTGTTSSTAATLDTSVTS
jgi:hypothetical protein